MQSKLLLAAALGASLAGAETVIGVYAFHRHGDRTAKSWQPVNLTSLGADEVFASGSFFRSRYLAGGAEARIAGISPERAVLSQLALTAPADNVLHNSASVFAQGLYPPSASAGRENLANGSTVLAPLGGYQYIPVNAVAGSASSADDEESTSWLQGQSGCNRAVVSSNNYLQSPEYIETAAGSRAFYQSLLPVINGTFDAASATFKNGYTIFDLINVATIHNASISSKELLTNATLSRLYDLASTHEWNLAFNASDPVRAISGAVLAGQILGSLQAIAEPGPSSSSSPVLNVQFGAYGAFMSFFGLAQLQSVSRDFYGVCDYASSMVFELVAPGPAGYKPEDLSVRFFFSNGTATAQSFRSYPLFGQKSTSIGWPAFKAAMGKFAIADTESWCAICGNAGGPCSSASTTGADAGADGSSSSSRGGISKAVAGVIGALVTLVVVLAVEAAVLLVANLRLVKKSTLAAAKSG
ncbi:hypothetical protein ESCO_000948 [Escovopsis weberi]|uniref:Lysosomal acid phosphatase n=1 Tax=Escovopsis weberi TaxID=150374 RepID=A0A0N0RT87_ESCWE|nr:hypothetical protein ESCO_000948 [Escovopsis weberi]